jgi:hypothetical protein
MKICVLSHILSLKSHSENYFPGLETENPDCIREPFNVQLKGNILNVIKGTWIVLSFEISENKISNNVSSWIQDYCTRWMQTVQQVSYENINSFFNIPFVWNEIFSSCRNEEQMRIPDKCTMWNESGFVTDKLQVWKIVQYKEVHPSYWKLLTV